MIRKHDIAKIMVDDARRREEDYTVMERVRSRVGGEASRNPETATGSNLLTVHVQRSGPVAADEFLPTFQSPGTSRW